MIRKIKGFSLIELIISMAMLSVIILILFDLFKQSHRNDSLNELSYKFAEYISAVKTRALEDSEVAPGVYNGVGFVKNGRMCKGGLTTKAYLPCSFSIKNNIQTTVKKESGVETITIKLKTVGYTDLQLADIFLNTQNYFEQFDSLVFSKATVSFELNNDIIESSIIIPYQGDAWIDVYGKNQPYADLYFDVSSINRDIKNISALNFVSNPETSKSIITSYMDDSKSVLSSFNLKFPKVNIKSQESDFGDESTNLIGLKYKSLSFNVGSDDTVFLGSENTTNVSMDDFYVPFFVNNVPFSKLDNFNVDILYVGSQHFENQSQIKIDRNKYNAKCNSGNLILEASLLNSTVDLDSINLEGDEAVTGIYDKKGAKIKKNIIYRMPTQVNIVVDQDNFSVEIPKKVISGNIQLIVYCSSVPVENI